MATYTTNIPLARERLGTIADRLREIEHDEIADRIEEICDKLMTRRPSGRRAPVTRSKVTKSVRRQVLHLLRTTDMTQEDVAARFNIDGGRVSEIWNDYMGVMS